PEPDPLESADVLAERLELLVIKQICLAAAHLRKVEVLGYAQRLNRSPFAVLPIATRLGDLADVDLRVEVRGEGFAVTTRIAVHDVDRVHGVEQFFLRVRTEHIRHTGIEA